MKMKIQTILLIMLAAVIIFILSSCSEDASDSRNTRPKSIVTTVESTSTTTESDDTNPVANEENKSSGEKGKVYITIYSVSGAKVVDNEPTIGEVEEWHNNIYTWVDKNGRHWSNMGMIITRK